MSDSLEHLKTALADRYAIERQLGEGGMAIVFLAEDLKHGRKVALKVLRPELTQSLGADRFLREIRIAAQLSHPNILPLYDSGRSSDLLYYTMPYVAGESLRVWLDRQKQVPIEEAVQVAREVADALDYAHEQGVVHRDVKPENILFQGGHALVADFGVAVALSAAGGERLTQTGLSLGTPQYMSPEQAAADPALDARSDVYALGCIAYEMLTGEPPFSGPTAQAVIAKHIALAPAAPAIVRQSIPRGMSDAVVKALAKLPVDRFSTCAAFVEALSAEGGPGAVASERSIAVLPFANMSVDPENEYFCDGVAEEIINALTQVAGLKVAGRTSAFSFKGKNVDLQTVGEKLNVRTVLEGSVRKAGSTLRITAQLVDTTDGYHLWSERYDRELRDVFAIQDEIAGAIAERLQVTLVARPVARARTDIVEAYELYLKGRALLYQRGLAMEGAPRCFEDALALDPDYALAHAGLADAYSILGYYGMLPPGKAWPRARAAAERAIELGPELAESHCARAVLAQIVEWNWELAEREFLAALELNPAYIQARCWYALIYLQLVRARHADAIAQARRAVDQDPLSGYAHAILGEVLGQAGHDREGVVQLLRAAELDPASFFAVWNLGMCHHRAARFSDAEAAYRRALSMSGRHPWVLSHLGITMADSGRTAEAEALSAELEARARFEYVQPSIRAMLAAALGAADNAIALAHQACDERDAFMSFAAVCMPMSEALRRHPRFGEILDRMHLR